MFTKPISDDTRAAQGATERARISCPGCGRNDYVAWPAGQASLQWTCFNCQGKFELHRGAAH
jgi:hypothetical protein